MYSTGQQSRNPVLLFRLNTNQVITIVNRKSGARVVENQNALLARPNEYGSSPTQRKERMKTPLEHESDQIREALAEKDYRRKLWKPTPSFPLGVVLVLSAAVAFMFGYVWVGAGLVAVYVFCTAFIEPRLFFQYQGIGVFIDIAVLIASIIKNDFGVWLLYVFAGTHVLVALLFGLVYFLFAEE